MRFLLLKRLLSILSVGEGGNFGGCRSLERVTESSREGLISPSESISSDGGERGELISDGYDIWSTQLLLTIEAALMRFDPRRLAEQKKRKLESFDPLPAKKRKGKEIIDSSSTIPRPAPPSKAGAIVINMDPAASYFRLFVEHIKWLDENKKSLEEDLQSTKDCLKAVEEKIVKEEKTAMGLKKQLQEKLNEVVEKNKTLLNLQRKVNEGKEKLLELQQEASRISDLEAKIKKLEEKVASRDEILAIRDKALLTYQRYLEHWKSAASHVVEEYKSFEDFVNEVMEALQEAFDSGFNSCKSLVEKFSSSLDLSSITKKAGLALATEMEIQLALEVGSIA
ncbi:hypothetical protein COCNU_scaffold030329G000010 [Cocos nucifera]|nr:hypothetical protein [Cocos nucifera]